MQVSNKLWCFSQLFWKTCHPPCSLAVNVGRPVVRPYNIGWVIWLISPAVSSLHVMGCTMASNPLAVMDLAGGGAKPVPVIMAKSWGSNSGGLGLPCDSANLSRVKSGVEEVPLLFPAGGMNPTGGVSWAGHLVFGLVACGGGGSAGTLDVTDGHGDLLSSAALRCSTSLRNLTTSSLSVSNSGTGAGGTCTAVAVAAAL